MMRYQLCVIHGDGIGGEVIEAAVSVLQTALPELEAHPARAGWDCFQDTGEAVPQATLDTLRQCGAGLFGATQSPTRKVEGYRSAILTMRQELDLYANLRPAYSLPRVSPRADVDLLVVRENTEGMYVGKERIENGKAIAERHISHEASYRIAALAARLAASREGRLTIAHKANVLPLTCGLFRDAARLAAATVAPQVQVDELLIDVAAMYMAAEPERFDVAVTTNLFGDILSDISANWIGGLGLAPSLNLGEGIALAEPVHGSAPDIAGKGIANPSAAILSAAMLCRYHWQREDVADQLEAAVANAMEHLGPDAGSQPITEAVIAALPQHATV